MVYVFLLAVLNVGLGFALAAYLARRRRDFRGGAASGRL